MLNCCVSGAKKGQINMKPRPWFLVGAL